MLAVGSAVGVYFVTKSWLGAESASWLCLLAAAPVAVGGFFNYNDLNFEQFVWAWFKSQVLFAQPRVFKAENIYCQGKMIKTLQEANRSERDAFKIPRSVQQSIPIRRIYRDGIWQVGNKFSRCWRFADINYLVASEADQRDMFMAYSSVINSLPTGATAKITINNRRLNGEDFQHSVLMRLKSDKLDKYRQEYNAILTEQAMSSSNLIQDKYITISVAKKQIEEARTLFKRVDIDLAKGFGRLDSGAKPLDNHERLRIFYDFFRPGEESSFRFDLSELMRLGHSFKDHIAPDGMRFGRPF